MECLIDYLDLIEPPIVELEPLVLNIQEPPLFQKHYSYLINQPFYFDSLLKLQYHYCITLDRYVLKNTPPQNTQNTLTNSQKNTLQQKQNNGKDTLEKNELIDLQLKQKHEFYTLVENIYQLLKTSDSKANDSKTIISNDPKAIMNDAIKLIKNPSADLLDILKQYELHEKINEFTQMGFTLIEAEAALKMSQLNSVFIKSL